jgi:hypothetical protein
MYINVLFSPFLLTFSRMDKIPGEFRQSVVKPKEESKPRKKKRRLK